MKKKSALMVFALLLAGYGLPYRAGFRHAFCAHGVYTGYAAVVLPGVREAVGRKDSSTAAQQLGLVQGAIERGTVTLTQALQRLGGGEAAPAHATTGR
jgi:N-acetylated-alpha-linked acidic dipeptidase